MNKYRVTTYISLFPAKGSFEEIEAERFEIDGEMVKFYDTFDVNPFAVFNKVVSVIRQK